MVTQNPANATHLAAHGILRTHKFIAALAFAPTILSIDYVDESLESDKPLDPEHYLLRDSATEKKLGFTLKQSFERARKNNKQLLAGQTVYCVEDIHGGFDTMKSIVEVNGGSCQSYRGRPLSLIPSRRADSETDDNADAILVSGTTKENKRLWSKFEQMAEGARKVPRLVRPDWLLETAMGQMVLPLDKFKLNESDG